MGVYLYCITPSGHRPPDALRGVHDGPVSGWAASGLTLWVSVPDACPAPARRALEQHNAVVVAAAESGAALPVRFGQYFADPAELEAAVAERRQPLVAALDDLTGTVEFGVRLLPRTAMAGKDAEGDEARSGSGAATNGVAYLRRAADRARRSRAAVDRAADLADSLRTALGETVRRERVDAADFAAGRPLGLAHLVPTAAVPEYRRRLDRFLADSPDFRSLVTGPWPPYSFVPGDAPDG